MLADDVVPPYYSNEFQYGYKLFDIETRIRCYHVQHLHDTYGNNNNLSC